MTRKVIALAGLAVLGLVSIGSLGSAKISSAQLRTGGDATVGYPLKVDIQAELEANRPAKSAMQCTFMRRSHGCPQSPWGAR